ncbi:DJ-1/PfpI family protein [Muricauda sp. 2012CJ35-5]|uniref:DJ-1/PfpI family protein n=1 Tax=Flagellimonas spongiicola TaxID=2942208 RepID=A0ABT0PUT4_9FLAO|nr:DJ-1/PfpI family protein [Allomuricauda spongiicola]MCL6275150.1 DJ-1/PfpI family protein [Allomuricauda spongiicola]
MRQSILTLILSLMISSTMAQTAQVPGSKYVCPPCNSDCDEIVHDSPGVCEHCNMALVEQDMTKTIAFYLQDGVEVLDFAGPLEVFVYSGYRVFTVSEKQEPIVSQGVLDVVPDYSIDNAPEADILAFFGGNANAPAQNKKVIDWIKAQEDIEYHFSVCTGAFVLAEAGILDGKTATTFHSALNNFEKNYPKIDVRKDVRYVDNGEVITTAGISAGIDGALHLVAKLQGLNAAKRTAYYMEYDNWQIGNGLILSDDNPYLAQTANNFLEEFEGQYEYENNTQLAIRLNKNRGYLEAVINEIAYPVYHESGDLFSDVGNDAIQFERNSNGKVTGYYLADNKTKYLKL